MASLRQIGANGVERLDVSLNQINSFFSSDPEFWKVGTKSFFHVIFNEKKKLKSYNTPRIILVQKNVEDVRIEN